MRVIVLTGGLTDRYIFHFSIPELAQISRDSKKLWLDKVLASPFAAGIARWFIALHFCCLETSATYQGLALSLTRRLRNRVPMLLLSTQMMALYYTIENCRKLTIAAMNGTCNGGGTEMAACFDFRFMVDDAGFTIGQPEVLVGILAGGGGTQRVTRLIGQARALEFMLACEQWTPQQAKDFGLITDHFPKASFVEQVQAYADRMSRRNLIACRETRSAIRHGGDVDLSRGLALELAGFIRCTADAGTQAALAEYTRYIDEQIIGKPDSPASIAETVKIMESDQITRHYLKPKSSA